MVGIFGLHIENYAKTPYKPQKYAYFLIYNPKSWRNILTYANYSLTFFQLFFLLSREKG